MTAPQPDSAPRPEKIFPVSWDQFHRDSRALAWRLHEAGPFEAIVCITRGGLVPAAIVARELNVRMIETVCVVSYRDYRTQSELSVLKGISPEVTGLHKSGKRVLIVDDLVDTGKTARVVRDLLPMHISPPSTPSRWGGRWSTPSLLKSRRTRGFIFPGTRGWRSSRRSARVGTNKKLSGGNPMLTRRHLLASAGAIALGAATGEVYADSSYANQPITSSSVMRRVAASISSRACCRSR